MRSRPDLTVFLSPSAPFPGERVAVEARFTSTSDTPLDRVVFDLVGLETVRVQHGKYEAVARHHHLHLRAELPGAPLTPGTHTYRATFALPDGLPPAYRGRHAFIEYTLEVRADIPWWPDRVGRFGVPVAQGLARAAHTPGVFVTDTAGARSGELYAELSLASTVCEPGGEISGTVVFTNAAKAHHPTIALVAYERVTVNGAVETLEAQRWAFQLCDGSPEEGRSLPFRVGIEPTVIPGLAGAISALVWVVEVTTEHFFLRRSVLQAPIVMVPRAAGASRETPTAAPAVGRERHATILAQVGRSLGLEVDAEHDELRGTHGSVAFRVAVETRPDGTLATVAHLAWPSLGLGLSIGPRTWTDRLASRRVETGVPGFDERFHVRSRFPEQAHALLDGGLCALLRTFPEAVVNDEGATLAVPRALLEEVPLADFAARASQAGRAFDEASARVPLPPPLAGDAEAWRALAARLGGRFEPGSAAIHDGTLGLERIAVATQWSDDGKAFATVVRVPLDVRVDPETVSPAARAQVTALGASAGGRVAIEAEEVTLTIDGALTDPLGLEGALDDLARLVHVVRRREGASPFRS